MAGSTSEHPDAGMRAVARVRGVREQDSRLGLRRAAADEREALRRLQAADAQLTLHRPSTATAHSMGTASFLAIRAGAAAMASEAQLARESLATATTVTTAARAHWQRDKTRLSAVELLLERRADERRAERARREAAEIDDIVSVRWLHARRGGDPA